MTVTSSDRAPESGRNETWEQRDDRNLAELLQELRVAGLGIQVLFGFLLSLPFTNRFQGLDSAQRHMYLAALYLAAASIVLLTAPVAYHRLTFRRHRKEALVRWANHTAIAGLFCVAGAVSVAVCLAVSFVTSGPPIIATAVFVPSAFLCFWLSIPLLSRRSDSESGG